MTGAKALQVWFFELHDEDRVAALLQQVQYSGAVDAVALNAEHAAVLCRGANSAQNSRIHNKLCFTCWMLQLLRRRSHSIRACMLNLLDKIVYISLVHVLAAVSLCVCAGGCLLNSLGPRSRYTLVVCHNTLRCTVLCAKRYQVRALKRAGQIHVHSLPAAAGAAAGADPQPAPEAGQGADAVQHLDPNPTLTLPPPGAPADMACAALRKHFLAASTALGGLDPNSTLTLPPPGAPSDVACAALSDQFLVAGTASGGLWCFRCAERAPVAEARHAQGVTRVWPQPAGVRRAGAVCRRTILRL